jgi:thiamine-monophosphate kinase
MKLSDLGEDAVVREIIRDLPPGEDLIAGPGDDCAVLGKKNATTWRLAKTDAVIEGVHFLPGEDPLRVGWKALCRAISDIAAMGGLPEHALITLAAPGDTEMEWVRGLYAGLGKAARKYGVGIVGGETARSRGALWINVALTGRVERKCCVLRSGGNQGDWLYVTGLLGGSLSGKHLDFYPRLDEARWLVKNHRPTAMMDLSDGLGADLPRMAAASGCDFELWPLSLPCSFGSTPLNAMNDGEDFELLFSIAPDSAEALEHAWKRKFPRLPLTRIGRFTRHTGTPHEKQHSGGYDHFKQP